MANGPAVWAGEAGLLAPASPLGPRRWPDTSATAPNRLASVPLPFRLPPDLLSIAPNMFEMTPHMWGIARNGRAAAGKAFGIASKTAVCSQKTDLMVTFWAGWADAHDANGAWSAPASATIPG